MHTLVLTMVCGIALSACNSDSPSEPPAQPNPGSPPQVTVDTLPAGRYDVAIGDANAPQLGHYYAAENGERLLIVDGDEAQASTIYRQDRTGTWRCIPAALQTQHVALLRHESAISEVSSASTGDYDGVLGNGERLSFRQENSGSFTALPGGCQLTGERQSSSLPGLIDVSVRLTQCGTLDGSYSGQLEASSADAPRDFRLVLDNGHALLEVWAYRRP
ncbi:hypothetical protein ACTSKR_04405 [Chitinibacteraceae bacterium HSL-7]